MRRTGSFAWGSAGGIAVDAVAVPVILIPLVLAPGGCIRQFLLRICLLAMLSAEFLTKLDGTCGAVFHATAACDAVLGIHLGDIGAAAEVGMFLL